MTSQRWLPLFLGLTMLCLCHVAHSKGGRKKHGASVEPQWFLVPPDDLGAYEALEYSILSINEMRRDCDGFHLAPLQIANYNATEVYLKDLGIYEIFRLHVQAVHGLAPGDIIIDVAREKTVTDLSLFQVIKAEPLPCDLFSDLDDAELLIRYQGDVARKAKNVAISELNKDRAVLCPQRPQLQFIRIIGSSVQPAEGIVVRLVLELREASKSFETSSFTDVVSVMYALDQDVPSQCTISPEVYPARHPCKMRYTEEEESAEPDASDSGLGNEKKDHEDDSGKEKVDERRLVGWLPPADANATIGSSADNDLGASATASFRRLGDLRHGRQVGRRLLRTSANSDIVRPFEDKNLQLPDKFDPRLERTLCFPRGFSRHQGSCGSSWAFAATAVASFRECLWRLHGQKLKSGLEFFSAQELTSCDNDGGCAGGSALSALHYMKHNGLALESCSPYQMRCFEDNSMIAVVAADVEMSTPKSKDFHSNSKACPAKVDVESSPCKCLPGVYHFTKPINCELLPNACAKEKIPHFFQIAGTAQGNTIPQMERQMQQELISDGPLYVSMLIYEDFYDPVSWTESGVYVHRRGHMIGKHAAVVIGWGTDLASRDYWLLLNSFGKNWQQDGYFKIARGGNSLRVAKFGAWGIDWSHNDTDKSKPHIFNVDVALSSVQSSGAASGPLANVLLQLSALTDESAKMLMRVQGLDNTATAQTKSHDFATDHVLKVDILKANILGQRAKIEVWAVDEAQNTARWGPFTFQVPNLDAFQKPSAHTRLLRTTEAVPEMAYI